MGITSDKSIKGFLNSTKITYTPGYKQQTFGKKSASDIHTLNTKDRNINFIATHEIVPKSNGRAHSQKVSEHKREPQQLSAAKWAEQHSLLPRPRDTKV